MITQSQRGASLGGVWEGVARQSTPHTGNQCASAGFRATGPAALTCPTLPPPLTHTSSTHDGWFVVVQKKGANKGWCVGARPSEE